MSRSVSVWHIPGEWTRDSKGKAKRKPPVAIAVSSKRPPGGGWESDTFIEVVCPDINARLIAGEVLQPHDVIKANWSYRYANGLVDAWLQEGKRKPPSLGELDFLPGF